MKLQKMFLMIFRFFHARDPLYKLTVRRAKEQMEEIFNILRPTTQPHFALNVNQKSINKQILVNKTGKMKS